MDDESQFLNDLPLLLQKQRTTPSCTLQPSPHPCFIAKTNSFMYHKYSSSQNYHYTKQINNIIANNRSPNTIRFTDDIQYSTEENLLKRLYQIDEYPGKIEMLSEYYKYHEDVPRVFMMPVAQVVHNFYDKKRRINYIKITKMLREENPDMTDDDDLTNINIHDTSSNISLCNNETLPKSLNIILPDEMSSYRTRGRISSQKKDKMKSSLTVCDLNDILSSVFKKSGKYLKQKGDRLPLRLEELQQNHSISLSLSNIHHTKELTDIDLTNHIKKGKKRMFASNINNDYTYNKSKEDCFNSMENNVLKDKQLKKRKQFEINEKQLKAFKKKKDTDVANIKLSIFKNKNIVKKMASKNNNIKNIIQNECFGKLLKYKRKTVDKKSDKIDKKNSRIKNLKINNLNINININGTAQSNKLLKEGKANKRTNSIGITNLNRRMGEKKDQDASLRVFMKSKDKGNGKSINITNIRKFHASCDNNKLLHTINKAPLKAKPNEIGLDLRNIQVGKTGGVRRSLKHDSKFATFMNSEQINRIKKTGFIQKNKSKKSKKTVNTVKKTKKTSKVKKSKSPDIDSLKKQLKLREPKGSTKVKRKSVQSKNTKVNRKKLAKSSKQVQIKTSHRNIAEGRKHLKSSRFYPDNPIRAFLSQDIKESRDHPLPKQLRKNKPEKRMSKTGSKAQEFKLSKANTNFLSMANKYKNKFSTFGASFKEKTKENPQFNTINYMNLFNNKRSFTKNEIKTNIENSIKGALNRKDKEKRLTNESQNPCL